MLRFPRTRWLAATVAATISGSALGAAGDLDCTFGIGGKAQFDLSTAGDAFHQVLLQPDGRIVLLGNSLRLTRLTPNGDLDPAFGVGGSIQHTIPGLGFAGFGAIDSQGRILVAGRVTVAGDSEGFVARFTSTGAVDTTFGGGDGWVSFDFTPATAAAGDDLLSGIVVDALDRPLVAGTADLNGPTFVGSNADVVVVRLTASGELDPTFGGGDGIATISSVGTSDDRARGLKLDTSGRAVVFGDASPPNVISPRNTLVARFTTTGVPDTSFSGDGLLVIDTSQDGGDDFGSDLAFAPDGDILLLSSRGDDPTLSRLDAAGALDTSFGGGDGIVSRSFFGGQDVTENVLVQADGRIVVTGWPVTPASGGTFHLASMRFDAAGNLDATWGGTGIVSTSVASIDRGYDAVLQPNGRLIIAGGADNDVRGEIVRYLTDADGLQGTTTTITGHTPDPSDLSAPVLVDVTVSSAGAIPPSGSFTVSDGPASCTGSLGAAIGGSASGSCSIVPPGAGNRTLIAAYDGNASLCRSNGAMSHTVLRAPTTLTITSRTPDPSIQGEPVTISWSLTSPAPGAITGNVAIGDGNVNCLADASVGSCTLTFQISGTRSLFASYAGNSNYAPVPQSFQTSHVVLVQVTPASGPNGAISPSTPQTGTRNSQLPFTLVPDPGYHVESASGCNGTRDGPTFTTGPLVDNCTVSATFNADPVGVPGELAVLEDSGANAGQLVATDADPLTYAIASPASKGSVTITGATTGAYTYTPTADAVGADSFTFRASDAGGSSTPTTVTIAIAPVNDAPSLALATLPAIPGGTTAPQSVPDFATFDAGPPDEDATQSVAAYLVDDIDDPSGVLVAASIAVATDGTLTYTPTGTPGTATFSVRVRDDGGTANGGIDTSAPQTATLVVENAADLQVEVDDGRDTVVSGDLATYAIVATNAGPSSVTGAALAGSLSPTLVDAVWSCRQELSTVPCPTPASGSGAIETAVDLPVDGVLRFDLTATVSGDSGAFVTNTATIAAPPGVTSLVDSNDSSTDQDTIVPVGVFADGFEAEGSGVTVPQAQAVLPRR